jgi:hypothetical protein
VTIEPGDVANRDGDVWTRASTPGYLQRVITGIVWVTEKQADKACLYGWERVPLSEKDGLVKIERKITWRRSET